MVRRRRRARWYCKSTTRTGGPTAAPTGAGGERGRRAQYQQRAKVIGVMNPRVLLGNRQRSRLFPAMVSPS